MLLGHLQSDAIESRFGWLRQLSGANYFISMKQVLDSYRTIRALSLLKFTGLSVKDIDEAIQTDQSAADSAADSVADSITEALTTNDHWPSSSDANIIFYVSAAIVDPPAAEYPPNSPKNIAGRKSAGKKCG